MELQQILSKMEADGWEIADDFKKVHGHFLQYFLETVEEELRQPPVMVRSEQLPCYHCGRPLKEYSEASKLCPDRMKNFEQGN
jgi:hypothetical protein